MEYILNLVVLKLALMYYLNKLGQGKKDEKSKFIKQLEQQHLILEKQQKELILQSKKLANAKILLEEYNKNWKNTSSRCNSTFSWTRILWLCFSTRPRN